MRPCQCLKILSAVALLTLIALPAGAYMILLDIDTDNDPATINDITEETTAVVKVVLQPTEANEEIGAGGFGLGGSCLECDVVPYLGFQVYGTWFDLGIGQDWVIAPGWTGSVDGILLLGCAGDPGYHTILNFEPSGGGTVALDGPIFLSQFNAGVGTYPEECPKPPSNLAAFSTQGELWNYVQIGGPAVEAERQTWGQIKAIYR